MLCSNAHGYMETITSGSKIYLILVKSLIYFLYSMYRCHVVLKGESKWGKKRLLDYDI